MTTNTAAVHIPPTELICYDCGRPHTVVRANAKRCRACALLEVIKRSDGKLSTCKWCGDKFPPFRSTKSPACGRCDTVTRRQDAEGPCLICKRETLMLHHQTVPVCRVCLASAEHRDKIARMLTKGQHERQDQYADNHRNALTKNREILANVLQ